MTLHQAIEMVRVLLQERPGETGLADDEKIARMLNVANRSVWKRAMALKPDQWLWTSPEVICTPSAGLSFASIAGADATLAAELEQGFGQSDMSGLDYVEVKVGSQFYPILPLNGGRERTAQEPLYNRQPPGMTPPPYRWYITGMGIQLSPPPVANVTCRVVWAPTLLAAADDDSLLWGRYAQHHDAVAFKAAILLYASDEGQSTPWDREYKEAMDLFVTDLEGGGQTMQTRRVSPRGPFN